MSPVTSCQSCCVSRSSEQVLFHFGQATKGEVRVDLVEHIGEVGQHPAQSPGGYHLCAAEFLLDAANQVFYEAGITQHDSSLDCLYGIATHCRCRGIKRD